MSGILAIGNRICNTIPSLSAQVCVEPSSQRIALLVAAGVLSFTYLSASYAIYRFQNRPIKDLKGADLYSAASCGNLPAVKRFIAGKSDLNFVDPATGDTALICAARNGHTGVVRALLDAGARFDQQNKATQSALYVACENGFCEIVDALLKKGADVNEYGPKQVTPLMLAAKNENLGIVARLLMVSSPDLMMEDEDGKTVMHYAAVRSPVRCQKEMLSILKLLYEASIVQRVKFPILLDNDKKTPIHCAIEFGNTVAVDYLLPFSSSEIVDVQYKDGNTPLRIALDRGYVSIALLLIRSDKVDLTRRFSRNQTYLQIAKAKEFPNGEKLIRLLEQRNSNNKT